MATEQALALPLGTRRERRRYARVPYSGQITVHVDGRTLWGDVVDLGRDGLGLRGAWVPCADRAARVRLDFAGVARWISARVTWADTATGSWGMRLLEACDGLRRAIDRSIGPGLGPRASLQQRLQRGLYPDRIAAGAESVAGHRGPLYVRVADGEVFSLQPDDPVAVQLRWLAA